MDLYLVKDQPVEFTADDLGEPGLYLLKTSEHVPVTLEPVVQECVDSKEYCEAVTRALSNSAAAKVNCGSEGNDSREILSVYLLRAVLFVPTSTANLGKVEILGCGGHQSNCLFGGLIRVFKRENLSFNLTIKDLDVGYVCGCTKKVEVEVNDVHIEAWNNHLVFDKIKLPVHDHTTLEELDTTKRSIRMTVTVTLNETAMAQLSVDGLPRNPAAVKNKILLEEAIASDLVVVAANGVEVKCHKNILMVSSDVFRAMFETEMQEKATKKLVMEDMSEDGVRAFLNFIYWSDVGAAKDKCDVAFELFRAGDKYGISSLHIAMKTLICSKGVEWFNVGMAVRLALLVQNLEEKQEIMKKVAQVLKWYSKNSPAELLASEEYQELFRDDPQVAMKLMRLFFEFV